MSEKIKIGNSMAVPVMEWMKDVCSFALLTGARMTEILTTRVSGAVFRVRLTRWLCDFWRLHHETLSKHVDR